jgi:hypothetical protein
MQRSGVMVQVSIVVLLVAMVGLGAGGLYSYSTGGSSAGASSTGNGALTSAQVTQNNAVDSGGKYLGYVPNGYVVAPLLPNSPSYPCPSNYNSTQCAQFKASCGNGVCDPNETCSTCPIDCGVPQGLSCDPYTGRASGLGGICELTIPYTNTNPAGANQQLNTCQTPGGCTGGG